MPETASDYASSPIAEVPPLPKKRCNFCAKEIEFEAKKCTACGALQDAKDCVACGARIPPAAKRCGSCSTLQDWRRMIPGNALVLALLLSLISVITAIAPGVVAFVNRPSRTSAVFVGTAPDPGAAGTGNDLFVVRVDNSGGLPSVVERAQLQYRAAGLEPASMRIVNFDQMEIPANGKAHLKLDLETMQVPATATYDQIAEQICRTKATLQMWVQERDRWGTLHAAGDPLKIELRGKEIRDAVLQRMAGEKPKKDCS